MCTWLDEAELDTEASAGSLPFRLRTGIELNAMPLNAFRFPGRASWYGGSRREEGELTIYKLDPSATRSNLSGLRRPAVQCAGSHLACDFGTLMLLYGDFKQRQKLQEHISGTSWS